MKSKKKKVVSGLDRVQANCKEVHWLDKTACTVDSYKSIKLVDCRPASVYAHPRGLCVVRSGLSSDRSLFSLKCDEMGHSSDDKGRAKTEF